MNDLEIPVLTLTLSRLTLCTIILTLAACKTGSSDDPDDTGDEFKGEGDGAWAMCTSTETPVTLAGDTSAGFDAQSALAAVVGDYSEVAAMSDGSTTALSLTLASGATSGTFVDQEPNTGETSDGNEELADAQWSDTGAAEWDEYDCDDYILVDATLSVATDDGALAELFTVSLSLTGASSGYASGSLDYTEIAGSYTPDVSGADSAALGVNASFDSGTTEGGVSLTAEGTSGDSMWASNEQVATWPGE